MLPKINLADVRSRMFNRPLLVTRDKALDALGVMGPKLSVAQLLLGSGEAALSLEQLKAHAAATKAGIEEMPGDGDLKKYCWDPSTDSVVEKDPYEIWQGLAVFPVRGTLMAENGIDPMSGATGYDGLSFKVRHATDNPAVRGGIIDIDSGGGEVVDLFELCQQLLTFAGGKPLRAIVRGQACSAAYALAACAGPGNITAADYSWVGSIGAIMMHADFSKQLEKEGIDVSLIASAPHKADGTPVLPLDPELESRLQASVDEVAGRFIDHVAAARAMDRSAIVAQEARYYSGQEAISLGLVDQFMSWDESMRDFSQKVNGTGPSPGATAMLVKGQRMSTEKPGEALANMPEHLAAVEAATATGHTAGLTAGTDAERSRILALVEIDGKSSLSESCMAAINAGTSVGDHAVALAQAAKAAGPAALEAARLEAAKTGDIPKAGARAALGAPGGEPENRGKAYADRKKANAQA